MRVSPSFEPEHLEAARYAFDVGGAQAVERIEQVLSMLGRRLSEFHRLLDFGCGCGRYIRHLGPLSADVEIHGVDIDAEMIAWLQHNVPFGSFVVGPHLPPLPYEDGYFDLVVNHSVFTHLDAHHQDLWLAELQRVTGPDGMLLLTVETQARWDLALSQFADAGENVDEYRARMNADGIVFVEKDSFVGSTHPEFYHSTFHAPWYVFEHWGQYFEVLGYLTKGAGTQDLVILRRRRANESSPESSRRQPDEAPAPSAPAGTPLDRLRSLRWPGRLAPDLAAIRASQDELLRAIRMVEAALYEQGRRISVTSRELRDDIHGLAGSIPAGSPSPTGAP